MEPHKSQPGGLSVLTEPAERQFVGHGQHDQDIGGRMPVAGQFWKADGEAERGVRRLTRLRTRRQIGAGNEIQTLPGMTLAIWHNCSI